MASRLPKDIQSLIVVLGQLIGFTVIALIGAVLPDYGKPISVFVVLGFMVWVIAKVRGVSSTWSRLVAILLAAVAFSIGAVLSLLVDFVAVAGDPLPGTPKQEPPWLPEFFYGVPVVLLAPSLAAMFFLIFKRTSNPDGVLAKMYMAYLAEFIVSVWLMMAVWLITFMGFSI